jgi:integrase/recombinase XerC
MKGLKMPGQGKQAKILSEGQIRAVISFLDSSRYAVRDKTIFMLSVKAGLRAKEISSLKWWMVTDAEGLVIDSISLDNQASKGKSGRTIPMHRQIRDMMEQLRESVVYDPDAFIIYSERGDKMRASSIVGWFKRLYESLGFDGCSSHSGRRTFITNAAKKTSLVGGSLRDVQELAGHSSLTLTQRYVEGDTEAKRKLISLL